LNQMVIFIRMKDVASEYMVVDKMSTTTLES